ncbi:hypothetical protein HRW23_32560 [Streptomyces lunaelactis]|uniref:hypothetical protein n=1 Tax=Streptomyces lunaelactis TaxID=1535768 RepID=UPI001584A5B3|nr:hypothetical protein [Streptomyces lunaelactis]NUK05434.1 hypothetical protein [Streptomyces lunaelactis]NUK11285.1 hypothetical protein [Streptomyces lunaelactis]NUK19780.1 hypothetical protein [Streptomyces lunaelactis]NUK25137.1 hypothetical protein [Streptomyces lunaelactis]NUK36750.1 hypothetical protein [Streptomyces lunaelactis]
MEQFSQGDRVEYRNHNNEDCQGTVERVDGTGRETRYTIQNARNQMMEQVEIDRVARRLS